MKRRNRKGSVFADGIFLIMVLFVFATMAIIGYTVFERVNADTKNTFTDYEGVSSNAFEKADTAIKSLDYMFIFLIVGLSIASIISVFMIKTHPIFFFVSVLILIVVLVIAAQFSNIFYDISQHEDVVNATDNFTIIPKTMEKLPLYILIISILTIIFLYGKSRYEMGTV